MTCHQNSSSTIFAKVEFFLKKLIPVTIVAANCAALTADVVAIDEVNS